MLLLYGCVISFREESEDRTRSDGAIKKMILLTSNREFRPLCLYVQQAWRRNFEDYNIKVLSLKFYAKERRKFPSPVKITKMRLLMTNTVVGRVPKSFRFLILLIVLLENVITSCSGTPVDGVSLRFNKRGEREKMLIIISVRRRKRCERTSNHLENRRRNPFMKASLMLGLMRIN